MSKDRELLLRSLQSYPHLDYEFLKPIQKHGERKPRKVPNFGGKEFNMETDLCVFHSDVNHDDHSELMVIITAKRGALLVVDSSFRHFQWSSLIYICQKMNTCLWEKKHPVVTVCWEFLDIDKVLSIRNQPISR